jgi:hypothetical protein
MGGRGRAEIDACLQPATYQCHHHLTQPTAPQPPYTYLCCCLQEELEEPAPCRLQVKLLTLLRQLAGTHSTNSRATRCTSSSTCTQTTAMHSKGVGVLTRQLSAVQSHKHAALIVPRGRARATRSTSNTQQYTATHSNTQQYTAMHSNTQQCTAMHSKGVGVDVC